MKNNENARYEKSDQSFLKQYNIKKILDILRKNESLSRIDLSESSCLDKKTITNITKELLENRQLKVVGHYSEGMGRPKEMLGLNGDYCYCIGVDLGGTYISGIVMDFTGRVICSHYVDLFNDMEPQTLIKVSHNLISNLLKKADMTIKDIEGIGISIPGFIDKDAGLSVISENIPKWFNIPLKQIFQDKYHVDVFVEDCSRLMALAELWYGDGRDVNDFLVFDLGLGIGCGIVIDQKIFAGSNGKSGEVGHTIVEVDGPLCTCGRHGCIESLASGWALSKQANTTIQQGQETLLNEMKNNRDTVPTTKDIKLAAELGDKYACNLLIRAGKYIGIGIANAISFFNPTKVIINGRLIWNSEVLSKAIKKTLKEQTMSQIYNDVQIIESNIGFLASAMGAATLCLEKYY